MRGPAVAEPHESRAELAEAAGELLRRAVESHAAGRMDEARALCTRVVARKREDRSARGHAAFMLGVFDSSDGEHAAAKTHYVRACEMLPDHAAARCNLGQTLIALDRTAEAVVHLRRAIELRPALGEARLNLATALRREGDTGAALDSARMALESVPGGSPAEFQALVLAAELEAEGGDLRAGVALSRRALEAAGSAPAPQAAALVCAGKVCELAGTYDEALGAYRRAVEVAPESAAQHHRTRLVPRALRERLAPRASDVFISTFPKSGTTWMQQIVCSACPATPPRAMAQCVCVPA